MRKRGGTWTGAVVLVTLLAAGCGGAAQDGGPSPAGGPPTPAPDPLEQVVAASEATLSARSARFTMKVDVTGGGNTLTVLTGAGGMDYTAHVADMEMSVVRDPSTPPQRVRSVMIGNLLYQRPAGQDRWFVLDAAAVGQAQSDPAEQIRQFRTRARDVRDLGVAEVNGKAMRHYELTLSTPPMRVGAGAQAPTVDAHADLYLDDQGRFARLLTRTSTPTPNQVALMTMDLSDYGSPVSVQAPDPRLVESMPR
ncbi:hypothetical protein [Pseudonocardia acaciae]|uniref:hypothetical protein n=1 Tax=Pseudonocardia acaciae TaxID=551276 RepID=UPI0012ED2F21|nr:hypothetical protein [Pseudonocardia acaciae]